MAEVGEGNKWDLFLPAPHSHFLVSLNDLSSPQAASSWANLPATMKLYCITQPGNSHAEMVGSRNCRELVNRSSREFVTLFDGAGEVSFKTRQGACLALDTQVIDQPSLNHSFFT